MPQVSDRFGPIYQSVVLDGTGAGTVTFQAVGANVRITNLFVKVSTQTSQATATMYKGQVADGNIVSVTNSGSTGAAAHGMIDLLDGETAYVKWTGGDAGATATATFVGVKIPFDMAGPSQLVWDDPIAAGDGSLIYPALKSPNYQTTVSGWKIDRNGNAEFNSVTVRGELDVISSNGSYVKAYVTGIGNPAIIALKGPTFTNPSVEATSQTGVINADIDNTLNNSTLLIGSPSVGLSGDPTNYRPAQIALKSGRYGSITPNPVVEISGSYLSPTSKNCDVTVYGTASAYTVSANGIDVGTGCVAAVASTANSAAIGATETVVLTASAFTYKALRLYKVVVTGGATASVANNSPLFRIRKTNAAGQQIDIFRVPCIAAATTFPAHYTCYFKIGGSDVSAASIVLTITGSAGFNAVLTGAALSPCSLAIFDIGDSGSALYLSGIPTLT